MLNTSQPEQKTLHSYVTDVQSGKKNDIYSVYVIFNTTKCPTKQSKTLQTEFKCILQMCIKEILVQVCFTERVVTNQ